MKKVILSLLIFVSLANASLVTVPIIAISDNSACNYFFSLGFFLFLFFAPVKMVLQILWDYASHRKTKGR
ncbi:MAG: hypothetical protein R3331_09225 [Sulfurospirillaceae bacterium]|nr:hypothetical protein [Sulfurospirillaceae bacterium]